MLRLPLPTTLLRGLAVAAALLVPSGSVPAAEADPESLQFKLSAERQAIDVPLDELRAQYTKALERLRDEVTQAGDLARRLQIDREIAYHSDEGGERPEPGDFAPLAKLRTIYEKRRAELLAQAESRREKLLVDYRAAFDALQKSLTVENRIEEAVEARKVATSLEAELERLRAGRKPPPKESTLFKEDAPAELAWETPFAGTLGAASSTELEFTGATKPDTFGAAVVKNRLPKQFTVRGQIQISGYFPGIVIAYEADDKPFAMVYPVKAGTQVEIWHAGKRVQTDVLDIQWKFASWESFEVVRDTTGWTFKLGSQKASVPLPDSVRGSRFGFLTFGPGVVKARRLSVTTE